MDNCIREPTVKSQVTFIIDVSSMPSWFSQYPQAWVFGLKAYKQEVACSTEEKWVGVTSRLCMIAVC